MSSPVSFGQIIRWGQEKILLEALSSAAVAQAIPSTFLAEVRATAPVYIRFGDETVEATQDNDSHLFPAGVQTIIIPVDEDGQRYTHVSVVRAGAADGIVQICQVY